MAEDRRTKDLSALKEQLRLLDECNQAKDELKKIEKEINEPKELSRLKKPTYKGDILEAEYHNRIRDIDCDISNLEKKKKAAQDISGLGIALLILAFVLGIVTLGYYIVKRHDLFSGLLVGAAVFGAIFVLYLIVEVISDTRKEKALDEQIKNYKNRKEELAEELKREKKNAAASDKALRVEYDAKKKTILEKARAALQPKIDVKKKEVEELNAKYEAAAVIPHSDNIRKELKKLIWAITERYADTIPEARRYLKEENDRQIFEKKRAEDEAREKALMIQRMEEERRRNSPGTVVVYATEDGKGKNADVYVDGGYYGAISFSIGFTQFQLNPGPHNVSVVVHSQGYHFQSPAQSFMLEGGQEVNVKFALLGYNRFSCTVY